MTMYVTATAPTSASSSMRRTAKARARFGTRPASAAAMSTDDAARGSRERGGEFARVVVGERIEPDAHRGGSLHLGKAA